MTRYRNVSKLELQAPVVMAQCDFKSIQGQ